MALTAEEIVEEWLRRDGYFTIRGIKLGVHEVDLLAVKYRPELPPICRHIEVQCSMRPVSFITRVPKEFQRQGRPANSAKRSTDELLIGVEEWVTTKFQRPEKRELMQKLWAGEWSSELVLNEVKSQDEVELIRQRGVRIVWLRDVLAQLDTPSRQIRSASGADFVDLIQLGSRIGSGK